LKILILKPSSLGDVVHALPVLRLLKLHRPESEVFWWIDSSLAGLLEDDPDLAGIFHFPRRRWAAPGHWPEIWSGVRAMQHERFDIAIDLQGLARSAIFTWLANAELKFGLDHPREGARAAYDLIAPRSASGSHAVDHYLTVLSLLDVPVHDSFDWLPERPHVIATVRQKWNPDTNHWIALLPGARWQNKRWPIENFVELARLLLRHAPDLKLAILGGGGDHVLGAAISAVEPSRCLDLTGKTSLPEMVEWIRLSALVVTNDTGPMHVAAALRRPVVALFGPTDPDWTGPYRQRNNVLQTNQIECVPCMKDYCSHAEPLACLRTITPAQVCAAVEQRLQP
jgi:heptosyltransferase I